MLEITESEDELNLDSSKWQKPEILGLTSAKAGRDSAYAQLRMGLKVHKNENFFGFDFEFCPISLLAMHK